MPRGKVSSFFRGLWFIRWTLHVGIKSMGRPVVPDFTKVPAVFMRAFRFYMRYVVVANDLELTILRGIRRELERRKHAS